MTSSLRRHQPMSQRAVPRCTHVAKSSVDKSIIFPTALLGHRQLRRRRRRRLGCALSWSMPETNYARHALACRPMWVPVCISVRHPCRATPSSSIWRGCSQQGAPILRHWLQRYPSASVCCEERRCHPVALISPSACCEAISQIIAKRATRLTLTVAFAKQSAATAPIATARAAGAGGRRRISNCGRSPGCMCGAWLLGDQSKRIHGSRRYSSRLRLRGLRVQRP
mmetsp:Transcript_104892/g.301865  ORF Transcript_104892/g.301865 Transcript_104892/m.301865 type:complete len:225 (-) Transcript_104892:551-1225(-)